MSFPQGKRKNQIPSEFSTDVGKALLEESQSSLADSLHQQGFDAKHSEQPQNKESEMGMGIAFEQQPKLADKSYFDGIPPSLDALNTNITKEEAQKIINQASPELRLRLMNALSLGNTPAQQPAFNPKPTPAG